MTKKELAARLRIASGTVHFAPAADLSALLIEAADALSPDEPREDPLASVRWICPKCTTVNGIDDEVCLGGSCGTKRPSENRTGDV